jgi:hypothetical protein
MREAFYKVHGDYLPCLRRERQQLEHSRRFCSVWLGALANVTAADETMGGRVHARLEEKLSKLLVSDWHIGVPSQRTGMQSLKHLRLELGVMSQPDTMLVSNDTVVQ